MSRGSAGSDRPADAAAHASRELQGHDGKRSYRVCFKTRVFFFSAYALASRPLRGLAAPRPHSPSWTACRGWSRCRSPSWAPPPAPPPGSSPPACPRWRSWWTPPRSRSCPWLAGAPPEQLHVIKLVPVTTAVCWLCL